MKQANSEFIQLCVLILSAAFVIYFIPAPISRILFLLLLPAIWFSKKDYFWLAFFFIIVDKPGGLFSGFLKVDQYRLPMYEVAAGVSFSITELFYILIFIKVLMKSEILSHPPNFFKRELTALIGLFIFLILISFAIGISFNNIKILYRAIIELSLFYSFLRMINSKDNLFNFFSLLFPFAFIAVLLQLYSLINHQQLIALFKSGVISVGGMVEKNDQINTWIRPIELAHVLLICFTGTLFLISYKKHSFNKYYLLIVNFISFFGILITGTRSWVLAFIAGYIFFFAVTYKDTKELFRWVIVSSTLVVVLLVFSPVLQKQVVQIWSRLVTVEDLIKGDVTAHGTLLRLDVRAPRVVQGFESSTIFLGAGFSDHYFNYADGHVGYHNILLNTGIFGSIIFLFFILRLLMFPFGKAVRIITNNPAWLKITLLPLIILIIINSATQTIGFTLDSPNRVLLMSYAFIMINSSLMLNSEKQFELKGITDNAEES